MTTLSKTFLITLILSAFALSQGAPSKTQTNSSKPAANPATSQNGKNQKDTAAKGSHPSTMSGNHKDMMMGVAADKNQGSTTTHSGNMIGNHKDVMEGTGPRASRRRQNSARNHSRRLASRTAASRTASARTQSAQEIKA